MYFIYSMSLSNTPSAVIFLRKQKLNPRMSRVRRNASSSLGPDGGAAWGNPALKGCGSKVASLLWTVHLKNSESGRRSCPKFWPDFNIPLKSRNIQGCVTARVLESARRCLYVRVMHVRAVRRLLVLSCYSACVCLIEGVYSAIAGGYGESGPPCGSRAAARTTRMKETRDNKPLE